MRQQNEATLKLVLNMVTERGQGGLGPSCILTFDILLLTF